MLLSDGAPIIRRDSEMGKIRLKADLKLPVEMLNLFLTHVLPYWVVMPGYKQNCKFHYSYKEKAGQWSFVFSSAILETASPKTAP